MLHVIVEHALVDCSFLADKFPKAMLPTLEPTSFIGLSATVSMLSHTRKLAILEFAFVDFCAAEDILSAAILLICMPVSKVKATISVAHPTMTLLDVILKDALIYISVCILEQALSVHLSVGPLSFVKALHHIIRLLLKA